MSSPSNDGNHSSTLRLTQLVSKLLADYTTLLLKDGFQTPLIHHSLYTDDVPDITVLPLTTLAVSLARGMMSKDCARFMRRAIEGERHRLTEQFPNYQCLQQWDALHAITLYETLELRGEQDRHETWKKKPSVRGLRIPLLIKMARSYMSAYPELRNPDYRVFKTTASAPATPLQSAWHRWRITETARRTLFLINIVNWCCNQDYRTGKELPYYEPLSDELILSMPLPCIHRAWVANDEAEWRAAMAAYIAEPREPVNSSPSGILTSLHQPGQTLRNVINSPRTNRSQLSDYAENVLQKQSAAFEDSTAFWCFVVLAACQQFK